MTIARGGMMFSVIEIERVQDPYIFSREEAAGASDDPGIAAQQLVLKYLEDGGPGIRLSNTQIEYLRKTLPKGIAAEGGGVYVWDGTRSLRDGETIVVMLSLVQFLANSSGAQVRFDVFETGIRIAVHAEPIRILASSASRIELPREIDKLRTPLADLSDEETIELLAALLSLRRDVLREVTVHRIIWGVEPPDGGRTLSLPREEISRAAGMSDAVQRAMTAPAAAIGDFRPAVVADIRLTDRYGLAMTYRVVFDNRSVIDIRVLTTSAQAFVFPVDPRTSNGPQADLPRASSDRLVAYKQNRTLPALKPPPAGQPLPLEARYFRVVGGPTKASGQAFDYVPRTRDFAATHAFHHCVGLVELAETFGFPRRDLFPGNDDATRPIRILSPGPISPGFADGRCINAQVTKSIDPWAVDEMRFALADLSDWNNPLGLASDVRFAWHEFCHALLVGATDSLEFRFAHSAGDALAAIACDPDSLLRVAPVAWRGVTFPWVEGPKRRHDRPVEDGWSWYGQMHDPRTYPPSYDPAGYRAEQILSTTLFRAYLSLGGDSVDPARRRAASRYMLYLIIRAIATSATSSVQITTPEGFANRLRESDGATPSLDGRLGGTMHKVLRWAFEKQGAYFPSGTPWPKNDVGPPPEIDVWFEDRAGRQGEYGFTETWQATDQALWVSMSTNPAAQPVTPPPGAPCYVFARVGNRGSVTARNTKVQIRSAIGGDVDSWDLRTWSDPLALANGGTEFADIPANGTREFGPFEWTPPNCGTGTMDVSLLASASAPDNGAAQRDMSHIDTPLLPCRNGPIAIVDLVPLDNNLAYRVWTI